MANRIISEEEYNDMLGGDINDVITCREQMKSLLNGEEPMNDE